MSWWRDLIAPSKGISGGPERIADRPHRITVFTGLLSPTVAVIAVFFSYASWRNSELALETSQESLRVGQRAYLAIEASRLEVYEEGGLVANAVIIRLDFDIRNLGRTPATVREIDQTFKVPEGWTVEQREGVAAEIVSLTVGQDQRIGRTLFARVVLSVEAFKRFRAGIPSVARLGDRIVEENTVAADVLKTPLTAAVSATLEYTDVFHDSHSLRWTTTKQLPIAVGS